MASNELPKPVSRTPVAAVEQRDTKPDPKLRLPISDHIKLPSPMSLHADGYWAWMTPP
eukprot:CAMPEP_0117018738 /NCGR_PEP_ID=MMETSP0472-20121206/14453_1 /TAXON_ID=693140 ORGANISM="Tiarina fusus, Strain LIS" /NCGR_SAMPLE_ID=MMETSP0472 /ASSEMBLY_ACC=CAM_ASM_000603 /LENGTH=57 /DNA_ID=CAMNT_0004723477 /DNA_START=146 /DNA_END=316 /DNA_ORIENTATION=-